MKLFKRIKQVLTPAPTVAEIHSAIYSAHETLLKESDEIMTAVFANEEEKKIAQNIKGLGFYCASNIDKPLKAASLFETLTYYSQAYPGNKFINEDAVKKICEKYNLYLCTVSDYIAEIPLKNQKEILAFLVKEKDLTRRVLQGLANYPYSYCGPTNMSRKESAQFAKLSKEADERYESLLKSETLTGAHGLMIIAPESQIDMSGKKKVGHQIIAEDPIVLQPVNGGYLIVTAWGDEASDEIVVNQKMN